MTDRRSQRRSGSACFTVSSLRPETVKQAKRRLKQRRNRTGVSAPDTSAFTGPSGDAPSETRGGAGQKQAVSPGSDGRPPSETAPGRLLRRSWDSPRRWSIERSGWWNGPSAGRLAHQNSTVGCPSRGRPLARSWRSALTLQECRLRRQRAGGSNTRLRRASLPARGFALRAQPILRPFTPSAERSSSTPLERECLCLPEPTVTASAPSA